MISSVRFSILGGGFKHFLFSPLPGEDSQFDEYFSNGLKPPTSIDVQSETLHHECLFFYSNIENYGWKPASPTTLDLLMAVMLNSQIVYIHSDVVIGKSRFLRGIYLQ